jgi:hypothetical protein
MPTTNPADGHSALSPPKKPKVYRTKFVTAHRACKTDVEREQLALIIKARWTEAELQEYARVYYFRNSKDYPTASSYRAAIADLASPEAEISSYPNEWLKEFRKGGSPQDFSDRMDTHWSQRLNLITSPALRTLWGIMASTFRTSILNSINGVVDGPWPILQPPTGSGKTQGACVFAALQATANAQGSLRPVGILIVVRLKVQADIIAADINELAGRVTVSTISGSRWNIIAGQD